MRRVTVEVAKVKPPKMFTVRMTEREAAIVRVLIGKVSCDSADVMSLLCALEEHFPDYNPYSVNAVIEADKNLIHLDRKYLEQFSDEMPVTTIK